MKDKIIESINENIKELEAKYRETKDPAIKEMIDKQMTTLKASLRALEFKVCGEKERLLDFL